MIRLLTGFLFSLVILTGCTQQDAFTAYEISSFIDTLKEQGVDGTLKIEPPINDDMEYIATYVIAAYTSTRILSFFKLKNEEIAKSNLEQAMQNPKMSGQALNGIFLMAATFYPPDEEAVNKIKDLFLRHDFSPVSEKINTQK